MLLHVRPFLRDKQKGFLEEKILAMGLTGYHRWFILMAVRL